MNKDRGVLYIVFGEKYINEAILSASTVKKHNPDMHITFMCDEEVNSDFVDESKVMKVSHIRPKVDYIHLSPYKETVLLDSDTIVVSDISDMFDILARYDLAICHDLARKRENVSRLIPPYKKIPYSFPEVNPGVFVFKKSQATDSFFEMWRNYFYTYQHLWPYEQPTFRVSLWESGLNFYILPPEYNLRSQQNREKQTKFHHEFGEEHLKQRVYHMHHGKTTAEDALNHCANNYMPY